MVKMGSGAVAITEIGTGETAAVAVAGVETVSGNGQRACGGGSLAGGTMEVFTGGVGVTGQLATFAGRPWHAPMMAKAIARIADDRTRIVLRSCLLWRPDT